MKRDNERRGNRQTEAKTESSDNGKKTGRRDGVRTLNVSGARRLMLFCVRLSDNRELRSLKAAPSMW